MSEFQYYEFQAIDRPLTLLEMAELRKYSDRARITPTSFINDYQWGNFKGNQDAWMERYFDAFLYLANWGSRVLALRLPAASLTATTAKAYCRGGSAMTRTRGGQDVVTLEVLVVAQEVIGRRSPAQQFEDLFDRIPQPTDTRLPMTDVRVNRDAIEERRHSPSLTVFPDWSGA
jgi:hypothetical protein